MAPPLKKYEREVRLLEKGTDGKQLKRAAERRKTASP